MDQTNDKQVTVYATFNEVERKLGSNGYTHWDTSDGSPRAVVLVQHNPFPYNCPQTDEEEAQGTNWVANYWVVKITLPYSYLYLDLDDGNYTFDESVPMPKNGTPIKCSALVDLETALINDSSLYGTYVPCNTLTSKDPNITIEWLAASWAAQTEEFIVGGQKC